jgi:hypothetical protein
MMMIAIVEYKYSPLSTTKASRKAFSEEALRDME